MSERVWSINQHTGEIYLLVYLLENRQPDKARHECTYEPNTRCTYCFTLLTPATFTRDHVRPRSKGGKVKNNLVPCCRECNTCKGGLQLIRFLIDQRRNA